jgi:Pilus formation protein N terminal region
MTRYVLLAAAILAAPAAALGQQITTTGQAQEGRITDTITMDAGYVGRWTSPERFANIVIGRDQIADAIAQNDRIILISAKTPGSTNMLVLDDQGAVIANMLVSVRQLGPEPNKVRMFSRPGNLHAYWSYQCAPGKSCYKTKDENEGQERVPVPNQTINISTGPTYNVPAAGAVIDRR